MVDLETSERSSRVQLSAAQLKWEKKQFEKSSAFDGYLGETWLGWLARAELGDRNECRECGVEVNFGKICVNCFWKVFKQCKQCGVARKLHMGVEHKCPKKK